MLERDGTTDLTSGIRVPAVLTWDAKGGEILSSKGASTFLLFFKLLPFIWSNENGSLLSFIPKELASLL